MNLTLFDLALLAMQGGPLDPFVGLVLPPEYSYVFTSLDSALYKPGTEIQQFTVNVADVKYINRAPDSTVQTNLSLTTSSHKLQHDAILFVYSLNSGAHKKSQDSATISTSLDSGAHKTGADTIIDTIDIDTGAHNQRKDTIKGTISVSNSTHKTSIDALAATFNLDKGLHQGGKTDRSKEIISVAGGAHKTTVDSTLAKVGMDRSTHKDGHLDSVSQTISEFGTHKINNQHLGVEKIAIDNATHTAHNTKTENVNQTISINGASHVARNAKLEPIIEIVSVEQGVHTSRNTKSEPVDQVISVEQSVHQGSLAIQYSTLDTTIESGYYIEGRKMPGLLHFDDSSNLIGLDSSLHRPGNELILQGVAVDYTQYKLQTEITYQVTTQDEGSHHHTDNVEYLDYSISTDASMALQCSPTVTFSIDMDDTINMPVDLQVIASTIATDESNYTQTVLPVSATLSIDIGSHFQYADTIPAIVSLDISDYKPTEEPDVTSHSQSLDDSTYQGMLIGSLSGAIGTDEGAHLPNTESITSNTTADEGTYVPPSPNRLTYRQQLDQAIYNRNYTELLTLQQAFDIGTYQLGTDSVGMSISLDIGAYTLAAIQCDSTVITCDNDAFTADYNIHV